MSEGLDFEFDFTGVKDLKKSIETFGTPTGFYHALVTKVERARQGEHNVLKFHFLLLAGTNKDGVRRTHVENVFLTDKPMSKQQQQIYALRLGLIKEDATGRKVAGSWSAAEGRHCVIQIVERTYDSKKNPGKTESATNISRLGIWPVYDVEVAACPKDIETLASDGIRIPIVANPPPLPGEPLPATSSGAPGAPGAPGDAGQAADQWDV